MKDTSARNIGIIIVAATGNLVVGLALWRVFRIREPHVDIDRARYPVAGVDLSAHNGPICFDSLSAAGIDFAYLKASEGISFRDSSFARNHSNARSAGMLVGAYHFFRFDCDGRRQAVNFLNAIDTLDVDLPLGIDVEEWGNPAEYPTAIVRERLRTMVALLSAAGRRVVIYTNKQTYGRIVRHMFAADEQPDLWICSFTDPPIGREQWTLWQHSHCGRLPGIRGKVDLNTFNGSRDHWLRWVEKDNKSHSGTLL